MIKPTALQIAGHRIASIRPSSRRVRMASASGIIALAFLGGPVAMSASAASPAPASSASAAAAASATCVTTSKVPAYNGFNVAMPATSGGGSLDCVAGSGNRGTAVTAIQRGLRQCYGQNITVDGIFGSSTAAALRVAQRQLGVTADGVYGINTGRSFSFVSDNGGCSRWLQ